MTDLAVIAPRIDADGLPCSDTSLVKIGVVNVTPDSFSDGGEWFEPTAAVAHGRELASAGAQIVDVGGESTRPGAERPSTDEELRRTIPVIRELSAAGLYVSIDTMRAHVADRAIRAGARMVNDVSGGAADPEILDVVAAAGVPYVAMHWRGHSASMQERTTYGDVVVDVIAELEARLQAIEAAGIDPRKVVVDPGLGFAKKYEHNWQILRRIEEFHVLGHRLLVGASRKAFLGAMLGTADAPRPATDRDVATAAISAYLLPQRVWGVRVHDVAATSDALAVAIRLRPSTWEL